MECLAEESDENPESPSGNDWKTRVRKVLSDHPEKDIQLFPDLPFLKARFFYPPAEVERKVSAFNSVVSNYDQQSYNSLKNIIEEKVQPDTLQKHLHSRF